MASRAIAIADRFALRHNHPSQAEKKRFNPLAGSEPTAYAATGTGTRYLPDEK
jgi:hypothetical protein